VIFQLQQANRNLEMTGKMREVYDNLSYEDNEIKQEPHSDTKNAPADDGTPSQSIEKEKRIDRF